MVVTSMGKMINITDVHKRLTVSLLLAGLVLAACEPIQTPTLSPGISEGITEVVEPMQINGFEVTGLEESPPQPAVMIEGVIGDSCNALDSETQSRDGNTISIQVNTRRTIDPNTACAELAQMYSQTIPLEGDFPPGDYTLVVNGVATTFALVSPGTPTPELEPGCTYDSQVAEDVPLPEDLSITPGETFAKVWRIRNSGTCAWDRDFTWVKVAGDNIFVEPPGSEFIPMPETEPGEVADISIELTLSLETPLSSQQEARFQVRTPEGQVFGEPAWVRLNVAATSGCTPDAEFVEDVTIPDDSPIAAGRTFVKTWRIRNSGTCTWDSGYEFFQTRGDAIQPTGTTEPVPLVDLLPDDISNVKPGAEVEVSVELVLSRDAEIDSQQRAYFQIRDPDGEPFGNQYFVLVRVAAPQ